MANVNTSFSPYIIVGALLMISLSISAEYFVEFTISDDYEGSVGNVPSQISGFPSGPFAEASLGGPTFGRFNEYFSLSNNGDIRTSKRVDRDDQVNICGPLSCCKLTVCAINFTAVFSGSPNVIVRIKIVDVNDNAPVFQRQSYGIKLLEGNMIPDTDLPSAEDLDSTQYGVKSYRLVDSKDGTFSVHMKGTVPQLRVLKELDYDTNSNLHQYNLVLEALDGGTEAKVGRLQLVVTVLDANDNSPIFNFTRKTIFVKESEPINKVVYKVAATDKDSGENGRLTYHIGNLHKPRNIALTKFAVDVTNGDVKVIGVLDYDSFTENVFELPIVATDNGSPRNSATATLTLSVEDVNDNAPVISIIKNNTIVEGSDAGQTALLISISDADRVSKDKFTCSQINGTGLRLDEKAKTAFFVTTTQVFDYEEIQRLTIGIRCVDEAIPNITIEKVLTVAVGDINDHKPIFSQLQYTDVISESLPPNSKLHVNISASDADAGKFGQITYRLDANGAKNFTISPTNGSLYVRTMLDRETAPKIDFNVIAKDGGNVKSTANVVVSLLDYNDNRPILVSPANLSVVENSEPGQLVGILDFKDYDDGNNGRVSIKLGDNTNSTANKFLALDTVTRRITTKEPVDRENYANLFMEVIAIDGGQPQLTSIVTLSIRVLDVNDNAPKLETPAPETIIGYDPPIYTSSKWHTQVGHVRASDPDQGENGTVTFRMRLTNATGYFQFDTNTGQLFTSWNEQNPPEAGIYAIEAELRDRGVQTQLSVTRFYVEIAPASKEPAANSKNAAISNLVILVLIIVFSIALGAALIAAIVWARSRNSRYLPDGGAFTDMESCKIPEDANQSLYKNSLQSGDPQIVHSCAHPLKSTLSPTSDHMFSMSPIHGEEPIRLQTFGNGGGDSYLYGSHSQQLRPSVPSHQQRSFTFNNQPQW